MKFTKLWFAAPLIVISWCDAMDQQPTVIDLSKSTEVVPDAATPLDRTPITLVPLTDNGALAPRSTQHKKKRHVSRSVSSHSTSNNNNTSHPAPEYWIIDINTLSSQNREFAVRAASMQRNERGERLDPQVLLEKLTHAQHKRDFGTLIRLSHNIQALHNRTIVDNIDDVNDTAQKIEQMLNKRSRSACLTALGFGALSVISSTAVALICFYGERASS